MLERSLDTIREKLVRFVLVMSCVVTDFLVCFVHVSQAHQDTTILLIMMAALRVVLLARELLV